MISSLIHQSLVMANDFMQQRIWYCGGFTVELFFFLQFNENFGLLETHAPHLKLFNSTSHSTEFIYIM